MTLEYNYNSPMFEECSVIQNESDENGFFPYVASCVADALMKGGIPSEQIKGSFTHFFICSNSVVLPYQHSFMYQLRKKEYRGLGSSKLFRTTPYNALASYLSISFETNGSALSFTSAQPENFILEQYMNLLCVQEENCKIIQVSLEVDYEGIMELDSFQKNNCDNRKYSVHLCIKLRGDF